MNALVRELRALHQAVTFFTRLPLPPLRDWTIADLQRASAYFPFVGCVVGSVAAAVWSGAIPFLPPPVASGLSLAATLLLTGAFHEDGFADVCDGFGGGYTKERVLEIMRDSRVGAFGAIGVVMMLGLKWQSVAALSGPSVPYILVAAHALSRTAALTIMATMPYVREASGKAKPLATHLSGARLVVGMLFGLAPLLLLLPARLAWAIVTVAFATALLRWWFRQRIGGYTGDCLGAVQQVCEVVFYVSVLVLVQ